jgi:hypothetical protein
MLGYKHSTEAVQKMLNRYIKHKHPMLGKHDTIFKKKKISLATRNNKNPMFNRKYSNISKNLISKALSKPVYMYKIIDNELELKEIFPTPSIVKLN